MAKYEYEVRLRGDDPPTSNKKKLVVEQISESYVSIRLQGDSGAILSFLPDGTLQIYSGTAEVAGFKPKIL